jgi:folate-binding Fe-S cluster repair protein YgfZ
VTDQLLWWTCGSGRIELQMTLEQTESVSHQGQCDMDVLYLSRVLEIRTQLDAINPAILAAELKEYGAWDAEELANHEENIQRILWIAGCDIKEESREVQS